MYNKKIKGSSIVDVLIISTAIVFLIIPMFSVVVEKYLLSAKVQVIKDAVDITNLSVYNAICSESLGKNIVDFNKTEIEEIYTKILAKNMKLNLNLQPHVNSIADGKVILKSIEIYTDNFPSTCPNDTIIIRPTIHSCIVVPLKPSFYSRTILNMVRKETFQLNIHVDSEIPVNN